MKYIAFLLAVAAYGQVTYDDLLKADPKAWLHYNGQYHSQRHSLLKQINTANGLQSVPIVTDGVMYVSQPNEVHALDARTGRLIWVYQRQPALQKGPNRGVAVYGKRVYMTTPDAFLVALDARTGSLLWETKIAETKDGYWSPAAPLVIKGKIIAGIAPGDHGLNGFLTAYDLETGKFLWRWKAIPEPGEPGNETWAGDSWKHGGGNTWLTGSYDPELNLLYWGIGNPAPDFDGDVRKGDNLYTDSTVALDADTGELKWYFQYTPNDPFDYDEVGVSLLIDGTEVGVYKFNRDNEIQNRRIEKYAEEGRAFIVGTPYPNNEVHTLTFDLRTGAPVPVRGLFAPGDTVMSQVATRVDRALRAQDPRLASALPPIEAKHITNVRVERDGLVFYFDHLPHAFGLPSAKLTFAQLSGLVRVMGGELAVTAAPSPPPAAGASPGLVGAVTRDGR